MRVINKAGHDAMRYGFYLPTRGPLINRRDITRFVRNGEVLGFHSVMVADHIAIPVQSDSVYPYTADGVFLSKGDALETLTTMSFIAGATEKLRIVSSVMIVPHRNPVFTAKALATIDVLSQGRVTVGVGVGWFREEFEALQAADFDKRGAVTNEYLEIFKKLWTRSPVSHEGDFYRFGPLRCEPLPVQKPHPPIWIGGHSRPALRRAARYGDGWHPVGAVAASPLPPEEMRQKLDELKRLTEAEGRDFGKLTISFKAPLYEPDMKEVAGARRRFTGSPEQVAGDIREYGALGISEVIFDFRGDTIDASMEGMDRFARELMPLTKS
jgi:probable F420-dependent oxidoreductase